MTKDNLTYTCTYQHEDGSVLTRATIVLCREAVIARPIGLHRISANAKGVHMDELTFMPHLKGDTLVPTTGS